MKKLIYFLSCCFALWLLNTSVCFAQLQEQRKNLAVGINGGGNFNRMDFSPRIPLTSLNSPTIGFTARYIVEKYFKMICGIQMELNYSQRGWKEKIEDGSGDTYHRNISYIEVPILAHLAFGKDKDKGLRFIVNLGPQFSYYLSDKENKSATWDTSHRPNGVTAQYGRPIEHKFDYGLVGGAGLEIRTAIGAFLLEGRYYYGLSDIFNNGKKDFFARSANTYMGIRLAYLIDIKK